MRDEPTSSATRPEHAATDGRSPRVAARRAATRAQILEAAWDLARELGPSAFTLRQLAARVEMRAPSLYEYFSGKDAIYDAMFADGNRQFLAAVRSIPTPDEVGARETLTAAVLSFLDFATEDPVRFQLLFQRSIAGWEPSPEAYAPAVEAYEIGRRQMAALGAEQRSYDLWTAMVSGLAHQQLANDPGGRRWHELADETVELFLIHLERSSPDGHP